MRYEVTKCLRPFAAAHHLPDDPSPCRKVHGHNWQVEATFAADHLENGMVVRFEHVKNAWQILHDAWDHGDLNDHFELPTTEHVAERILTHFRYVEQLPVVRVRVWETDDNSATVHFEDESPFERPATEVRKLP